MTEKKQPSLLTIILTTASIIGAVEVIGGVAIWPFVEDKIIEVIEEREHKSPKTQSFRTLMSTKMNVPEDEVHVQAGKDHKTEAAFRNSVVSHLDKIDEKIEKLEKFDKRARKEIMYYHPGTHLQVISD